MALNLILDTETIKWESVEYIDVESGTSIQRALLSYTVLRLIQPKERWSLYLSEYRVHERKYLYLECRSRIGDVVATHGRDMKYDLIGSKPLCNVTDIFELFPMHPHTLDKKTWVEFIHEDTGDPDSLIMDMLDRKIPLSEDDLSISSSMYYDIETIWDMVRDIPSPVCHGGLNIRPRMMNIGDITIV